MRTISPSRRRIRWFIGTLLLAAALPIVFALCGELVADWAGTAWEARILQLADGKTNDAVGFLYSRLRECCWGVAILLAGTGLLLYGMAAYLESAGDRAFRWVVPAASLVIAANGAAAWAGRAGVFWLLLWQGDDTNNQVRFRLKHILAGEVPAAVSILIVGNSQARAMIDERILNRELAGRAWVTELHYPGLQAMDLPLLDPYLESASPDLIVCAAGELNFFYEMNGEALPALATVRGLDRLHDVRRGRPPDDASLQRALRYGRIGAVLPLFRVREPVAERILGIPLCRIQQRKHDASLQIDLAARAAEWSRRFATGPAAETQRTAFEWFLETCRRRGTQVVVVVAPVHPDLAARLPADVTRTMQEYLQDWGRRFPDAIFWLPEDALPASALTFADLTHVTVETQQEISARLAQRLFSWGAAFRTGD